MLASSRDSRLRHGVGVRYAAPGAITMRSNPRTNAEVRSHPRLQARRLVLREFTRGDTPEVRQLAGAREIARMTLLIPYPYEDGMAEEWIASLRPSYEAGEHVTFAVVLREGGELIGSIGMNLNARDNNGELGYWIGVPYWGCGYCTEAARGWRCD